MSRSNGRLATVGEPFRYEIDVTNTGTRPIEGATLRDNLVADRTAPWPLPPSGMPGWLAALDRRVRLRMSIVSARRWQRGGRTEEVVLPRLAPGESARIAMCLTPIRRGTVLFAGTSIFKPDPLGLARSVLDHVGAGRVVVLPRRYPVRRLALPGTQRLQQGGVANAGRVGEATEFLGLRDYRAGDPPKRINWRSWARLGRPIVREHEEEMFVRQGLVLDTFPARGREHLLDAATSVAASLALAIDTTEALLDLVLVENRAYHLTAGRGLGEVDGLLEIIASARAAQAVRFPELVAHVRDHAHLASSLAIVLLEWDAARRAFVDGLAASGVPLAVFLVRDRSDAPVDPGDARAPVHVIRADRVGEDLAAL